LVRARSRNPRPRPRPRSLRWLLRRRLRR
jgi:hypothetical protein